MFFKSKDNLLLCIKDGCAYYLNGDSVETLTPELSNSLNNKYSNKHLILLDNYQINLIDVPSGTEIDVAHKIISFKIKEYIDYPLNDCTFDVLPTEASLSKYYAVSASKKELSLLLDKFHLGNLKTIDFFENALRNIAMSASTSDKASLIVYVFNGYTYIILMFKGNILSYRKLEIEPKDFDFWISEIQRSFDIFERQFRFTAIDQTVLVNLPTDKQKDTEILLKGTKFIEILPKNNDTPIDVYLALKGLACRV